MAVPGAPAPSGATPANPGYVRVARNKSYNADLPDNVYEKAKKDGAACAQQHSKDIGFCYRKAQDEASRHPRYDHEVYVDAYTTGIESAKPAK